MRYVPGDLSGTSRGLPRRLASCSSSKCISFFLFSFDFSDFIRRCSLVIAGLPECARHSRHPSVGLRLLISREPPHLNRHVYGCRGDSSRDGISALGVRNVNDPVAQQKFLRFRENAVSDWKAVLLAAYDL